MTTSDKKNKLAQKKNILKNLTSDNEQMKSRIAENTKYIKQIEKDIKTLEEDLNGSTKANH